MQPSLEAEATCRLYPVRVWMKDPGDPIASAVVSIHLPETLALNAVFNVMI